MKIQETVKYVKDHDDIFFKDHANAFFFLFSIVCLLENNFKKIELILDIIVHFSDELDRINLTKKESVAICILYSNSIDYLFDKKFFFY